MKTWALKILELQMQVQPFESYNIFLVSRLRYI